ncbi:DUF2061 domain-containing protein [Halapricum desulfuricans]|uniref:Uncharacterized membrane protein, DUF2061 family n=1 Tax=Halapricum desulfuricans TaxID=2841257 RepID=A0A897NWM2_9EURY|nr:DUF2061 domain-containing protein [Halapricum desulfuricans]QSG14516.1 Uncharacterized membrane protein, DUF2061 family [Halapricum desulfuricans]
MAGRSLLPITVANPRRSWSESLLKALVYRLFMLVLTVVVAYAVTADPTASLQIGVATNILKTGTYYAYERIWDRFRFEVDSDG